MGNTLLSFIEHRMPQALGEFGKAKNADVSSKIMSVLMASKKPIDTPVLWKHAQQDLESVDMLQKLLAGLQMANKIQWVVLAGDEKGWTPIRDVLSNKQLYVDFNLLVEAPKFV